MSAPRGQVLIATTNRGKLVEIRGLDVQRVRRLLSDGDRDLDDPRKWQSMFDQPDIRFGGPLINEFENTWPRDWRLCQALQSVHQLPATSLAVRSQVWGPIP